MNQNEINEINLEVANAAITTGVAEEALRESCATIMAIVKDRLALKGLPIPAELDEYQEKYIKSAKAMMDSSVEIEDTASLEKYLLSMATTLTEVLRDVKVLAEKYGEETAVIFVTSTSASSEEAVRQYLNGDSSAYLEEGVASLTESALYVASAIEEGETPINSEEEVARVIRKILTEAFAAV